MRELLREWRRGLAMALALFCVLLGAACSTGSGGDQGAASVATPGRTAVGANTRDVHEDATPTSAIAVGPQPCPAAVSSPSYWNPIVGTQPDVSAVERIICAHLTGTTSLQALILVGYAGTAHLIDVYVYDKITEPGPRQIFSLQGLVRGDARISGYNTLLTAEVDQNSSVNKEKAANDLTVDLYREFKWSDAVGTLVPVSFPGIFPDLTRYQAEADQQQVNQGHDPWKLDAGASATALAARLLKWPATSIASIVRGGGLHDVDAVVSVKRAGTGGSMITVSLSRLGGNGNGGIWIATAVRSSGMSITVPANRDRLSSPVSVSGEGSASQGRIGTVVVLDHLYTDIGHADAVSSQEAGNAAFSVSLTYATSFKTGAQEGLLAFYSYSGADGSIAGAVIFKELLS